MFKLGFSCGEAITQEVQADPDSAEIARRN